MTVEKAISPRKPRRLLLSVHDVSPRHESEVVRLIDLMHAEGADRPAMLVVPNFWGEAPIVAGSAFATRLRRWADDGMEMFLHGFLHRDDHRHGNAANRFKAKHFTAGEGEFLGLDEHQASARIAQGRAMIQAIIGQPIAGFIAPAWLYGPGTYAAMARDGIGLAEDHWRVWEPATGRTVARSPVITWATRTPLRLTSSLAVARLARTLPTPRIMRVGVHPGDVRSPRAMHSIRETIAALRKRHVPSRYADLLTDGA